MSTATETVAGRFGAYGGRYVPETLMAALEELEQPMRKRRRIRLSTPSSISLLGDFAGRPTPLFLASRLTERAGRSKDLSQTRRSAAYRRAQDQQLPRPGAAGAPHGQAPDYRGNRRRAARRGHRNRVRPLRDGMRGLHGRGRHAAPGAERLPHAPAGRRSPRRRFRLPDAQGRDQRSHARLGHQCAHHPLSAGQCARRASLSHHGARLSSRHRAGDQEADPRKGIPAAHRGGGLRRAEVPTRSAPFTNSLPTQTSG